MDESVVRLGSLDVRERPHRPAERLLELELRQRDLAGRLVHLEVGERAMADAVRFDPHTGRLELREIAPSSVWLSTPCVARCSSWGSGRDPSR